MARDQLSGSLLHREDKVGRLLGAHRLQGTWLLHIRRQPGSLGAEQLRPSGWEKRPAGLSGDPGPAREVLITVSYQLVSGPPPPRNMKDRRMHTIGNVREAVRGCVRRDSEKVQGVSKCTTWGK